MVELASFVSALHWVPYTSVSVSPTQSKASRTVVFQVVVYNGNSGALHVCEVDIFFQWDSNSWRISSGAIDVSSLGSNTWSISEAIPALQPGYYSQTVTVIAMTSGDFSCESSTWAGNVQILANVPPVAAFNFGPASPDTETNVQFTDYSNDPDGTIVTWRWDFGDGSTANTQSPAHRFLAAGTYSVMLTVTDNDGATNSASTNIQIVAAPLGGGPRVAGLGIAEWMIVALIVIAIAVVAIVLVGRQRRPPPTTIFQPPQPPLPPPP